MAHSETSIGVSHDTLENVLRPMKQAGITYDELIRDMAEQYDPEPPEVNL